MGEGKEDSQEEAQDYAYRKVKDRSGLNWFLRNYCREDDLCLPKRSKLPLNFIKPALKLLKVI